MREKERYKYLPDGVCFKLVDTETNEGIISKESVQKLLNQQDKRIKELEQENQQLKEQLNYYKGTKLGDFAEEIRQLKQQLAEHNEFFNAFACKDFNEFKDFISTFMLAPHEEQTLIRELKQQLEESEKENKALKDIRTLERVIPKNTQLNKLSNRDCYLKGFDNAISETIRVFEESYGKDKTELIEERNEYLSDIVKVGGYRHQIKQLKEQLHDLPKKIMEELKEKQPNFTENTYGFATKEGWRMCVETLNAILKKFGGEK